MNAAIALALEDHRIHSSQPRTWAALEIAQFGTQTHIRLDIGPRWHDGRKELATVTRTYYIDHRGLARYIEHAHP